MIRLCYVSKEGINITYVPNTIHIRVIFYKKQMICLQPGCLLIILPNPALNVF